MLKQQNLQSFPGELGPNKIQGQCYSKEGVTAGNALLPSRRRHCFVDGNRNIAALPDLNGWAEKLEKEGTIYIQAPSHVGLYG